jgi:hypothetical protein
MIPNEGYKNQRPRLLWGKYLHSSFEDYVKYQLSL